LRSLLDLTVVRDMLNVRVARFVRFGTTSCNAEDLTHASTCLEKMFVVGRLDGGGRDAVSQSGPGWLVALAYGLVRGV
jgi:hypothetical protein